MAGHRHSPHAQQLARRIADGTAVVGVVGLGYVGLPLALAFVEAGLAVLGFDEDARKVAALGRGESYIRHLGTRRVAAAARPGGLAATSDFARLGEPDAVFICVPTPLTPQRDPDMTFIDRSTRQVARCLRPAQLVVLVSTTYPGTSDELVRPILEASGLRCGESFFLAFSPEREDPGRRDTTMAMIPRIVGGVDAVSGDLAQALLDRVSRRTVRVSSARAAEATKLLENVYRAVNIALVNELKIVYDRMGIDVWEVIEAAATKPFGFTRFNPGPGWGGHCIPVDPFYLAWKAREHGVASRFIELAGETNLAMPGYVVGKLQDALNARGKPVRGARVLLLGLAYKKDVDDARESPAFEIMELLGALGAELSYHDPLMPVIGPRRRHGARTGMRSVPLDAATLAAADAVVIVTDHSSVDYDLVLARAPLIVDTRGVFRDPAPNVVKA